ncbi:uncharacterized protein TNCV_2985041 [Trichonephila clavipes]|nr:uncharacterized protein TNCV_2985041 [Trichonephila clavipes]
MKEGLIASSYECPKCNEQMGLNERKSVVLDGFEWRCRKKGVNTHDVCRSIRKNSWFSISPNLEMRSGISRQIWKWYMELLANSGNGKRVVEENVYQPKCQFTTNGAFLVNSRGVATTVSAVSMIRRPKLQGPCMCNYSPSSMAPISKKNGSEAILIQGPLRASYVRAEQMRY